MTTDKKNSSSIAAAASELILMENHDEAYRRWKGAGLTNQVLLHFDAHIDFKWISPSAEALLQANSFESLQSKLHLEPAWSFKGTGPEQRVHLGNYIHQAIQEGIVGKFIWIYPDDPDAGAQSAAVDKILQNTAMQAPNAFKFYADDRSGCFQGILAGVPFFAVPFSQLRRILPRENILLNIDLDFFITRSLYKSEYPFANFNNPTFWLSPQKFIEALERFQIFSRLITLAYSIEEGYTPLCMKFLANELAARLTHGLSEVQESQYALLGELYQRETAAEKRELLPLLERSVEEYSTAEAWFSLALLHLEAEDWEKAHASYEKAVKEDPAYRTTYNHPGPILWDRRMYSQAIDSYEKMQKLDSDHPDYRLFELKRLAYEHKWSEGISYAQQLLLQGLESFQLRLYLAECHFQLAQYRDAWNVLQIQEDLFVEDLKFHEYLWLKARTASKLGLREETLAYYHKLIRFGFQNSTVHWGLAGIYFKKSNFYKMKRHMAKAFQHWFKEIKRKK